MLLPIKIDPIFNFPSLLNRTGSFYLLIYQQGNWYNAPPLRRSFGCLSPFPWCSALPEQMCPKSYESWNKKTDEPGLYSGRVLTRKMMWYQCNSVIRLPMAIRYSSVRLPPILIELLRFDCKIKNTLKLFASCAFRQPGCLNEILGFVPPPHGGFTIFVAPILTDW